MGKNIREEIADHWPGCPPKDIKKCCYRALETQLEIGCSHAIIPAPIIEAREDEGVSVGDWIDAGIEAADQLDVPIPLLATIAVSEQALNDVAFEDDGLLDAIIDQVSARDHLDGVYIVIGQTRKITHSFQTSLDVVKAYLYLVREFGECGMPEVITNFADLAGLLCLSVGGTSFVGGSSSNHRLLALQGFPDKSGGKAFPYYYSSKVAAEFLTETHLDELVKARAFRRIRDVTNVSSGLVQALLAGGSAANLPAWAEGQNNYRTAHKHYVQRMILEGRKWSAMDQSERGDHAMDWLDECEANAGFIHQRINGDLESANSSSVGRYARVDAWGDLLREHL